VQLGGAPLEEQTRQALDGADVAVFLHSADAGAAPAYIERLRLAQERHAQGGLHVLPVLARPCDWDPEEFPRLRPERARPACFAAARGATAPGSPGWRPASTTPPATATTSSVFA
jgi:hypothetical protein